tara:strand:+ start:532 stop:675 length:144 start_codon:yes stop_codon:yes gene_type:complete
MAGDGLPHKRGEDVREAEWLYTYGEVKIPLTRDFAILLEASRDVNMS